MKLMFIASIFYSRKRIPAVKTNSPHKVWKLAKVESTSSPSSLTIEDLEEMGIGVLDSEDSSSSAASVLALALSGSAEENSNEGTPNLAAPKFFHQSKSYPSIDVSLDHSTDNANESLLDKTLTQCNSLLPKACSNNNFEIYEDEQKISKDMLATIPQRKILSKLGGGLNNGNHSNSNSPTGMRKPRSPLTIVPPNNHQPMNTPVCLNQVSFEKFFIYENFSLIKLFFI